MLVNSFYDGRKCDAKIYNFIKDNLQCSKETEKKRLNL